MVISIFLQGFLGFTVFPINDVSRKWGFLWTVHPSSSFSCDWYAYWIQYYIDVSLLTQDQKNQLIKKIKYWFVGSITLGVLLLKENIDIAFKVAVY